MALQGGLDSICTIVRTCVESSFNRRVRDCSGPGVNLSINTRALNLIGVTVTE